MSHTLTRDQANALHFHALALRPDWKANNPGRSWKLEETSFTLPHARDYLHALAALTAYCTEARDGRHVKRTPGIFPAEGPHWQARVPGSTQDERGPKCKDHPTFLAAACTACWGDVKVGMRPAAKVGQHHPLDEPQCDDAA